MRVLMIYRPAIDLETAPPPTPEQFAKMGQFGAAMTKAGVLLDTGGLAPSSKGARVRRSQGRYTITDGPYSESKELVIGFAIMRFATLAEAKVAAHEFLEIAGDGENEVRLMREPSDWDPHAPQPALRRYMMIWRPAADAAPPTMATIQAIGRLADAQRAQGILLANEGLQPSAAGARVRLANGKVTMTDGPFTEAKELIAGYGLCEVQSLDHAKEVAVQFLRMAGDGESEIRPAIERGSLGL